MLPNRVSVEVDVVPNGAGWIIMVGSRRRSPRVPTDFSTAVRAARQIARERGGDVVIRDGEGQVVSRETYGAEVEL